MIQPYSHRMWGKRHSGGVRNWPNSAAVGDGSATWSYAYFPVVGDMHHLVVPMQPTLLS